MADTYLDQLQQQIRLKQIERGKDFAWDSMTNQPTLKKVGDAGPTPASPNDPSAIGSISNGTPRVSLEDGEYELPDTVLTRNFLEHLIQKDRQPMPDLDQYGVHGTDEGYGSLKWYEKIGYRLNPANLKDLEQVTKQPLKFSAKKDRDGLFNLSTAIVPKNTAEFVVITGALLKVAKANNMRQMLFRFPHLEPTQQNPQGKPTRVKLDRVLLVLQMAKNLNEEAKRNNPDAPPMCIELSDTIRKRLAMQTSSEKERLLMAQIANLEKELKNEVQNDIKSGKREQKAAQEFLSDELKKNLAEAKKAHDALEMLSPATATPAQLQAALKALHTELNKVDANMKAIKQQLDSNVLNKPTAEEYKKSLDAAKTAMADITAQAQATLLNHADQGVKDDSKNANDMAKQVNTQNDAMIKHLNTQLAPHGEKADLLLPDYTQKLQAYQVAADALLTHLEGGNPIPPAELLAYQTATTDLNVATDTIKHEITAIENDGEWDTMRDKYEQSINNAANVTDPINERFIALGAAADPVLSQPAEALNDKTLGINGDITNDLMNAPQARP